MIRAILLMMLILGAASCGHPVDSSWAVELYAPGTTQPLGLPATVVLFEADAKPRLVYAERGAWPETPITLPPLHRGHYELWVAGCRPVRVDAKPTQPIVAELGYPVDVTWRKDAPIADGTSVHLKATWRGAGDHPEAILRNSLAAAAPRPGTHSPQWTRFVRGILIDPAVGTGRFYVPWPGAYRVTWGTAHYRIVETANSFSGSGGGSWSPGNGTSIVVPADGSPATVELPRR